MEGRGVASWIPALGAARRRLMKIRGKLRAAMVREPDLRSLHRATMRGYDEGFDFHQQAFVTDPKVHEWVLKPSYF